MNEVHYEKVEARTDQDGRVILLWKCPGCGADAWIREPKTKLPILRDIWRGECANCGRSFFVFVKSAPKPSFPEDWEPCRDVDEIVDYLQWLSYMNVDPMILSAAKMLKELHEKHWDECRQIGEYSAELGFANEIIWSMQDRLKGEERNDGKDE